MKKARNTFLLALALLSVVSMGSVAGTYARYTSTSSYSDTARVAKWGLGDHATDVDIFGTGTDKKIAPGSKGTYKVSFSGAKDTTNTEVDYDIALANFTIDDEIKTTEGNYVLTYSLVEGTYTVPTDETNDSNTYLIQDENANDFATAVESVTFTADQEYTLVWEWKNADANDARDTALGQEASGYNKADGTIGTPTVKNVTVSFDVVSTQKIN